MISAQETHTDGPLLSFQNPSQASFEFFEFPRGLLLLADRLKKLNGTDVIQRKGCDRLSRVIVFLVFSRRHGSFNPFTAQKKTTSLLVENRFDDINQTTFVSQPDKHDSPR